MIPRGPDRISPGTWLLHGALVLAVACGLYLVGLGSTGFAASEGFRVFPGWEMLDRGDWTVPHLFQQPYLRKPPGLPWAIAFVSEFLGRTELAARLPCALATIASCLLTFIAGNRWFGAPWGTLAGLLYALTPLFLMPGRSAEIEAFHNFFALGAAVCILSILIPARAGAGPARAIALALLAGGMMLAKGPAGLPVLGGAILAACLVTRSSRPLASPALWTGLLSGAGLFAWWALAAKHEAARLAIPPVVQGPGGFLWADGAVTGVLTLPLVALAGALPASLGVLGSLVPCQHIESDLRTRRLGAAAILACVLALLLYAVAGVSNNRYAMPALTLCPLCCAWGLRKLRLQSHASVLRRVCCTRAWVWALALVIIGAGHAAWFERRREGRTSGRDAGLGLAEALPQSGTLVGDAFVDARPEVLWYAQKRATELGKRLELRWVPVNDGAWDRLPAQTIFIVRTDKGHPEGAWANRQQHLKRVYSGAAHVFLFDVYSVAPISR